MKKIGYILALVFPILVIGQTQTENYIKSTTYRVETTNGTTKVIGGSVAPEEQVISIQYFDGLGRPKQALNIGAGGNKEDIITHFQYDQYGRQVKEFLPFSNGSYNQDIRLANLGGLTTLDNYTNNFYKNKYSSDFNGVSLPNVNAYSEKHLESSPLNRVLEQAAPGADWVLNESITPSDTSDDDIDHTIKFEYAANSVTDAVKLFTVITPENNPTLGGGTTYAAGELYKTITKDENWSPTQTELKDHTTEEFKNKQGQVILKRTYNLGAEHDTYYVYDDYGNLTFVLPPEMDASTSSLSEITNALDDLGYQYKYDERNRLIEKQIPGKEKELIIYDNLDRPVLTQDANLRANDKWLFTKYDVFGRVIYTGIFTTAQSESDLRTLFKNKTAPDNYEEKVTSGTGYQNSYYTNNDVPKTGIELLTINYYDNYTFDKANLNIPTSSIFGQPIISGGTQTKGLATGSKVRVLGETHFITTISGYDAKARPLYVATDNPFLKTIDEVQNKIDFVGKVLKSRTRHQFDNHQEIVTLDTFEYDHADRLIHQFQCIGDDTLVDSCTSTLTADLVLSNPNITGNQTATNSITINGTTTIAPGSFLFITDAASAGSEMIVENTYDELGQLESKKVGNSTANPLQVVDYTYNIRGWLKQINDPNSLGTDLFGFAINYNTQGHGGTELYNGNIAETEWKTANTDNSLKWYKYDYDALNRIASGIASNNDYSLTDIDYDKNGNIEYLERRGHTNVSWNGTVTGYGVMDKLDYDYFPNTNKLRSVDELSGGNTTHGFKDGSTAVQEYWYDTNGNMLRDYNKGISTDISYNHLNLPTNVPINGGNISYFYDATGVKLKKVVSTGTETAYAGNYVYENSSLKFFNHAEGYVDVQETAQGIDKGYVYQYKDIWGNIRLTYSDDNNDGAVTTSEIRREQNYYPFGLEHKGYNNVIQGVKNNLKQYQGQEFTEDLGLNTHEWKYRVSDPAIGRFWQIDPLAEDYVYNSTYAFQENKMGMGVELEGLELGDFPDPFESGIGAQESENRLMAQISADGMAILSEIGSFFDNFFAKGSATVSKDVTNTSGENGGTSTTVETTYSAEVGTNFESFFSNYNVSSDGTLNFNSDPFVAETDTKVTSTSKIKTSMKVTPIADVTLTGQLETDLGNGQTTASGRATLGIKDNGLFVSGSQNLSTGSSKVEGGLRAGAKTPKVNGFSFSANGTLGFRWMLDDDNP